MSAVRRSFSDCDPSHQTIFDGLVRRADSSTQLSSGVDTLSPGTAYGDAERRDKGSKRHRGKCALSLIAIKNFRVGGKEMQGAWRLVVLQFVKPKHYRSRARCVKSCNDGILLCRDFQFR